ncbi:protein of unknown function [Candidatus Methylomirabilis oxygeniifera]|uniref:Uncharacterized protein n=1 Tax=Methylomirabilis oxygeniifera TaxID=671143 RepID=D5MFM4_METO1|nr:protein of unknown function [Candidatus Methylomirabilis oxyfera]
MLLVFYIDVVRVNWSKYFAIMFVTESGKRCGLVSTNQFVANNRSFVLLEPMSERNNVSISYQ